jgi:predicted aspartyl protease
VVKVLEKLDKELDDEADVVDELELAVVMVDELELAGAVVDKLDDGLDDETSVVDELELAVVMADVLELAGAVVDKLDDGLDDAVAKEELDEGLGDVKGLAVLLDEHIEIVTVDKCVEVPGADIAVVGMVVVMQMSVFSSQYARY